jgi:TM2 domain-containing membrane protein YozV
MKVIVIVVVLAGIGFAIYQAWKASQTESKEGRALKSLPPSVQHVVAQMDGTTQSALFNEYFQKRRKLSVAYLLWILLGWHYLYCRRVGMQFAFWFTLGGFGIWWFIDLFRMPGIVRGANEQIARQAVQTLHIGATYNLARAAGDANPGRAPAPAPAPADI